MNEIGPFSPRATAAAALGYSRPRSCCFIGAIVCALGFFSLPGRPLGALLLSVGFMVAVIGPRGRCGAEVFARAVSYLSRSRWTKISVRTNGARCVLSARGRSEVDLYEFVHRGRLDLSGEDRTLDTVMATELERVAGEGGGTLSWHLVSTPDGSTSTLALSAGTRPPRSFISSDGAALRLGGPWLFERWRYVRSATDVLATFSLESSSASRAEPILRAVMPFGCNREASVLIHVTAAQRANSVVGRHSHRWRANVALAALGGFRQRASTDASTHLLEERERDVAVGRALCRVEIFITVRAATKRELEVAASALREDARRVATQLVRGNGRHAVWFCSQLPGAPGWSGQ